MIRHPADIVSLAFGLLFAAVGLVLLSDSTGALSWEWLAPAAVIVLGLLLIVAARPTRPDAEPQPPEA